MNFLDDVIEKELNAQLNVAGGRTEKQGYTEKERGNPISHQIYEDCVIDSVFVGGKPNSFPFVVLNARSKQGLIAEFMQPKYSNLTVEKSGFLLYELTQKMEFLANWIFLSSQKTDNPMGQVVSPFISSSQVLFNKLFPVGNFYEPNSNVRRTKPVGSNELTNSMAKALFLAAKLSTFDVTLDEINAFCLLLTNLEAKKWLDRERDTPSFPTIPDSMLTPANIEYEGAMLDDLQAEEALKTLWTELAAREVLATPFLTWKEMAESVFIHLWFNSANARIEYQVQELILYDNLNKHGFLMTVANPVFIKPYIKPEINGKGNSNWRVVEGVVKYHLNLLKSCVYQTKPSWSEKEQGLLARIHQLEATGKITETKAKGDAVSAAKDLDDHISIIPDNSDLTDLLS